MFCDFNDADLQYQYQQAGGDPSQYEEAITDVLWSDPTTECLKPLSHGRCGVCVSRAEAAGPMVDMISCVMKAVKNFLMQGDFLYRSAADRGYRL